MRVPPADSGVARRRVFLHDEDVQLRLPWPPRAGPSPRVREVDVRGRAFPIEVRRHRRARRYVLRMTPAGTLRLTVPRGASIDGGVRFAEGQVGWIAREWERTVTEREPWRAGTMVWYRGERRPIEPDGAALVLGPIRVACDASASVRAAIEAALRTLASDELQARAAELTRRTERRVVRISIRNQRSRWGACSSKGVITLNWRLIQMPPEVADYVILHELAHLAHPNHSRRFWREVETLCPWWRDSERWLRRHGRELL